MNLMIGNINHEYQLSNILSLQKEFHSFILFQSGVTNIILNYYHILNLVNKIFMMYIYILSSILPLGLQSLKYLLSGPQTRRSLRFLVALVLSMGVRT